jgi:hypothetical protein
MKWVMMRFPISSHDVLDALGAWEDSHGNGHSWEDRVTAKDYAGMMLARYVTQQVAFIALLGWALTTSCRAIF